MSRYETSQFPDTSNAINCIENEMLRRDFSDLLTGVEFGLKNSEIELTNICLDSLRTLAHSLCRTIGGETAVAIIEGLSSDGARTGNKALHMPIWSKGKICDVGGTATCISKANNKCNQSSTGCISTGTGIRAGYVWGVALLTAE